MAAKEIIFSSSARHEIAKGLNQLANAVRITLGPRGRNVVIEKSWGAPTVTKDGVTVAKEKPIQAKVIAVGAGKRDKDGKIIPPEVKAGDKILIAKYSGDDVKVIGKDQLILREDDVLAILEEGTP